MGAVWFRLQIEARSRWRAWVGLAVLIGVFAGAVIAVAAGARRTDTAYRRFVVASRAADLLVYSLPGGELAQVDFDQVTRLPQVLDSAAMLEFVPDQPDLALANLSGGYGTRFNRFKLLSGRLPDPGRADEAVIGVTLALSHHLRVGSLLHVAMAALPSRSDGETADAAPTPLPVTLRVVGVEAGAGEFPPQIGTGTQPVWAGPAFAQAYGDRAVSEGVLALRLRHGSADVGAVSDEIQKLGGGKPVATAALAEQTVGVNHAFHLQAVALGILAALVGVTLLMVSGQLLARQNTVESAEHPALSAVGMTGGQLWSLGVARAAFVGAGAAVVAAVVAVTCSPLFPIGLPRRAEPTPGLSVNLAALAIGALATLVVVILLVAISAWLMVNRARTLARTQAAEGRNRPSAVADLLARAGSSPTVTAGVRMGLETGRGRTAVPVRTTIIGSVVAMTALAASLTFQASLGHLLSSPRLYGVTFDGAIESASADITVATAVPMLVADPNLSAVAVGYTGTPIRVSRRAPGPRRSVAADGVALGAQKGAVAPAIIEGRAPTAPDEVALGTRTLHDLGAHVGQTVEAVVSASEAQPVPVRVVGRAVLPQESASGGLGQGTVLTVDGLKRLAGDRGFPDPTNAVVRFAPGVDPARGRSQLQDRLRAALGERWTVTAPDKPTDVVNFGHVQNLPVVLAAVLALLAAATIGHLLVSSVRRRRRDLAVLKTLGFVRRQVTAAVWWQATTLVVIALGVGVPLGVAVGRWAWDLLADQLGILARPSTPLAALVVLVPVALLLANAVAAAPAWSAGRTRAAVVLRSE